MRVCLYVSVRLERKISIYRSRVQKCWALGNNVMYMRGIWVNENNGIYLFKIATHISVVLINI